MRLPQLVGQHIPVVEGEDLPYPSQREGSTQIPCSTVAQNFLS